MIAGAVPTLWANKNGELNTRGVGVSEPSKSSSPRSRRWVRARQKETWLPRSLRSWFSWRALKWWFGLPIESTSDNAFALWLTRKLEDEPFENLALAWVLENAGVALGIDDEQVRRYLIQHTARGARFKSDGELITFRDVYDE